MRLSFLPILYLLAAFLIPLPILAEEEEVSSWILNWDHGPVYEFNRLIPRTGTGIDSLERLTPDFKLTGRIGGDVFADGGTLEDFEDYDNGLRAKVRRARIYTAGRLESNAVYDYKVQFAVENDNLFFNDFYVRRLFGEERHYLKVGYFDPPVSLEAMSSIGNYVLMELPTAVSSLAPGLRLGVEYGGYLPDPHLAWAFNISSIGQSNQNEGEASGSNPLRGSTRLVYLPHYQSGQESENLLHFGVGYSYIAADSEELQLRSRPESFLAPYVLDTGSILLDSGQTATLELLSIRGSYLHQAELLNTWAEYEGLPESHYMGAYYQTSYVLYGKTRSYDPNRGVILGIDNREPGDRPFPGALELAGRLSYVDLNSGEVRGGKQRLATLGLNWFINTHLAFKIEYIYGTIENTHSDNVSILQSRFQAQF